MPKYKLPIPDTPSISVECKDLIQGLLTADHNKRSDVADVLRHPFFLTDLPPGALRLNDACLAAQVRHIAPVLNHDGQCKAQHQLLDTRNTPDPQSCQF